MYLVLHNVHFLHQHVVTMFLVHPTKAVTNPSVDRFKESLATKYSPMDYHPLPELVVPSTCPTTYLLLLLLLART